jgi:hypothetical protein
VKALLMAKKDPQLLDFKIKGIKKKKDINPKN